MSSLVDQMINNLPIDKEVTWTPASLKLDVVSFHDYVSRVIELAVNGIVETIQTHNESQSGNRYYDLIRFKRLR